MAGSSLCQRRLDYPRRRQISMTPEGQSAVDLVRYNSSTEGKLQRYHPTPAQDAVIGTAVIYPSSTTNENLYAEEAILLWADTDGDGHYEPDEGEVGASSALSLTRDLPTANEPLTVDIRWEDNGRVQSSHVLTVPFGGSQQVELTFSNGQQAGVRVVVQYRESNSEIEIETILHGANFAARGGIVYVRAHYVRTTQVSAAVPAGFEYVDMDEYDVTQPYAIGIDLSDEHIKIATPAARYDTGFERAVTRSNDTTSLQSSNADPLTHFFLVTVNNTFRTDTMRHLNELRASGDEYAGLYQIHIDDITHWHLDEVLALRL